MALLTQIDNPVLWQEMTHQQRSTPRWMRRSSVVGVVALALLLAFTTATLLSSEGYPTTQFLLYAIWILHIAAALRSLTAGANVISREHVGQTWDALAL